jgi:hypothetical protein
VEEAFGLLARRGGPSAEELRRARGLLEDWLEDPAVSEEGRELSADEDEDDPAGWDDVAPVEVLNHRTGAH